MLARAGIRAENMLGDEGHQHRAGNQGYDCRDADIGCDLVGEGRNLALADAGVKNTDDLVLGGEDRLVDGVVGLAENDGLATESLALGHDRIDGTVLAERCAYGALAVILDDVGGLAPEILALVVPGEDGCRFAGDAADRVDHRMIGELGRDRIHDDAFDIAGLVVGDVDAFHVA